MVFRRKFRSARKDKKLINAPKFIADGDLLKIFSKVEKNVLITKNDILNLFASRGKQFSSICSFANELREEVCGDIVFCGQQKH